MAVLAIAAAQDYVNHDEQSALSQIFSALSMLQSGRVAFGVVADCFPTDCQHQVCLDVTSSNVCPVGENEAVFFKCELGNVVNL